MPFRQCRIALAALAILGSLVATTTSAAEPACSNVLFAGAPTAVPGGFGVPWNPFSFGKELLLSGSCTEAGKVTATVGGGQEVYVYTQGHAWDGSQWKPLSLSGGTAAGGSWIRGKATGSFEAGKNGVSVFLGYTCQFVANSWKCGCQNAECSAPSWQVQAVSTPDAPTTGGGGGNPTGKLENPPAMENPLVVENVCPEDARWPSASQQAGRDVKITLPKDRACKQEAHFGGTSDNPARNIWVSGGEIDFKSTAIKNGGGVTLIEWTGTAFFEGLNIDINNSCADGIRSYNPRNGRVVIQNSWIHGMAYCYPEGTHGDFYHAQGSNNRTGTNIRELVLQNVRADLIKQGLFVPLRSNGHGVRRLTLDHVELRLDAEYKDPRGSIATMIFADPTGGGGNEYPPEGQSYNEVYLNWWDPHYPATKDRKDAVLPRVSSFDDNGCSVYSADIISAAKLTGKWCKGSPATGTFVPLDKIGRNYDRSHFTKP